MTKAKPDLKADAIRILKQMAIACALAGKPLQTSVNMKYLVHDKRRFNKIVRELIQSEFIETVDEGWVTTLQAYTCIQATKPDLTIMCLPSVDHSGKPAKYTTFDLERKQGVCWDSLSSEHQKWIIEHPNDYRLFPFSPDFPGRTADLEPLIIGRPYTYATKDAIYVSDAALDAEHARISYENRFTTARNVNLAWGLKEQGLIEAVDEDVFAQERSDGFPFGPRHIFSLDPEKWGEEMTEAITHHRKRIAELHRETNVLCATRNKIIVAGGWEKILEEYDARLHEVLKDDDEEEEKEACSD